MEEIGAGFVERLATQHSLGGLVMDVVSGGKNTEAPVHLIPTAVLTVNKSSSRDFKEAHGIHQWWREDKIFETKLYQYK